MTEACDDLPNGQQLQLAEHAVRRASAILSQQAEMLAGEIDRGEVEDRGGANALRLLARLVRLANLQKQAAAGRG